jgi:hypothetical protein
MAGPWETYGGTTNPEYPTGADAPRRVMMDMSGKGGDGPWTAYAEPDKAEMPVSFESRFTGEPKAPTQDPGALSAAGRGAAQGATFNFADELKGLIAASGANPDDPSMVDAVAKFLPGLKMAQKGAQIATGAAKYLSGDEESAKRYALVTGSERQLDEVAQEHQPAANFAGTVAGGLASSLLVPGGGAATGATTGARIMQGMKAGAGYGATAGVGSGEDLASRTTGGVVGGVVGGLAGGALNGLVGARPAMTGPSGQDVAAAAERIGAPIARGVVSDSRAVQGLTQASRQLPILGGRVDDAIAATNTGLERAVNEGAAKLSGTSGSRDAVGAAARGSIERGIERAEQRADAAFTQVRRSINPDAEVHLPGSLVQDLDAIVQRRLASGETGVPIQGLQSAVELLTRPQGATFNGLQRARSEVGKAIKWDARNGGFITGDLKQAYGTLSDAMEAAVRSSARINPDVAVSMLTKANNLFGKVAGETKELSRLLSGNDERLVDRIISFASDKAGRGDIAKMNLLRRSMDNAEWQQVSALALQRMGQNNGGEFSPAFFVKNYDTMAPAAKELMFGKAGTGTRQWVDDIATVSKRMNDAGKSANFSNTGRATLTGLGLAGAGYTFTDPLGAAETALKTAAIGVPVVALLSRPATAASMARWSKSYEVLVTKPTSAALASFNVASRNFAHSVSGVAGIKIDPGAFLKALQGPVAGRAEDEQQ